MKILHIVGTLNTGGIEHIVTELSLYQKSHQRYEPCVACILKREGGYIEQLESQGIPVFDCSPGDSSYWHLSKKLHKLISDRHFEIIHSHVNYSLPYQILPLVSARKTSLPFVITQHSITQYADHRSTKIRARASYLLLRMFNIRHTAVSKYAANFAAGLYGIKGDSIYVIPNGIKREEFSYDPNACKQVREELLIPQDAKVLVAVGRLDQVKGYNYLLQMFAELLAHNPERQLFLLVAGDGPLYRDLLSFTKKFGASDRVRWLGVRRDIQRVLSAGDLFIMTSIVESISLSLLEALANGLEVISTPCGGPEEISQYSPHVHIVSRDNFKNFIDEVERQIMKPDVMRSSVLPVIYDFYQMASAYSNLYNSMIPNSKNLEN